MPPRRCSCRRCSWTPSRGAEVPVVGAEHRERRPSCSRVHPTIGSANCGREGDMNGTVDGLILRPTFAGDVLHVAGDRREVLSPPCTTTYLAYACVSCQ